MALPLRPVSHEARLPLLEHVGELRARLVITLAAVAVAFGFAFWQNHALLNVLNRPLARASAGALRRSHGALAQTARVQQTLSRRSANASRSSSSRGRRLPSPPRSAKR
jgi:hypothetical protein